MDNEILVGDEQEASVILPKVNLIASGYEWECQYCHHLNHEIEVKEEVSCECCKGEFIIADYYHAVG